MKTIADDTKMTVSGVNPFFPLQYQKTAPADVVQRAPGDDWVKDNDGNMYYKSKAEAEVRKKALEKKGEWTEYKVESFERGGNTFWRVLMRGPKSPKKEAPAEETPPKDTKPADAPKQDPKDTPKQDPPPAKKDEASLKDPVFALTFDDGPHASELGKGTNRTEKVLDVLKTEGIKGAFFIQTAAEDKEGHAMRGSTAAGKKLVKRMADEGHVVGIHTGGKIDHESHPSAQSKGTLEGELKSAKGYVKDVTGSEAFYVRPPKRLYNDEVSKTYGKVSLTNLLWDIDGDQGADLELSELKKRLDGGLLKAKSEGWKPWAQTISDKIVVLYHDIQKGTSNNLGTLIAYIKAKVKALSGDKLKAKFDKP
jgi:peptidoglycan/xylan/chitin deacetylase (PgdA/CDA1 family)